MNTAIRKTWETSRREIDCFGKTLVMAILNVTPDSFSDGGRHASIDKALKQAEKLICDGADILDIGGESTRPGSRRVSLEEELRRVIPVIESVANRFEIPISIDTTKSAVASSAIDAGAEIINDISGLRFDPGITRIAAKTGAGLVLMHLRGGFDDMHKLEPVEDVFREVSDGLNWSVETARIGGVRDAQICLDIGLGFGKSFEQNIALIGKLNTIVENFPEFPMLVGVSRKSFIGKILGDVPTSERAAGTIAANVVSVWNGANIVRVHDVRETIDALRVVDEIKGKL